MANKRWEEYGHVVEEVRSEWHKVIYVDGVQVNETFSEAIGRIMAEESLKKLMNPNPKQ